VSYSDDDDDRRHGSGNSHWRSKRAGGDDESWMDILVTTRDRGMGRQEAEFSARGRAKASDVKRRDWRLRVRSRVCLIGRGRRTMRADGGGFCGWTRIDAYDGDYFSQAMGRSVPTYDQGSDTHDSSTTG